jgi:hypothetical protein
MFTQMPLFVYRHFTGLSARRIDLAGALTAAAACRAPVSGSRALGTLICIVIFWVFMALRHAQAEACVRLDGWIDQQCLHGYWKPHV